MDFLASLIPPYFEAWHLPVVFVAGLIGEGYGTVIGSGGILIQFTLAGLGMPLPSVVATDIAGTIGANVGVITASPSNTWSNKKLLLLLGIPLFIGGICGTIFLVHIPALWLKRALIVSLILLLIHMAFGKKGRPLQPPHTVQIRLRHYPAFCVLLFVLGVYGNVICAGAGTFEKLAFVSLLRLSFADSLGICNLIGLPAGVFSLIVTGVTGLIAWPYLIPLWLGTFLGGHHVTRHVRKIPNHYLQAALVLIVVLYLAYLILGR